MEPTPNELKNAGNSAKNYVEDKTRQVAGVAQDKADKLQDRAEDIYNMARDRAGDYYDTSVDFVKKHPFSTVAGAAALGFIAGILLRRSRH